MDERKTLDCCLLTKDLSQVSDPRPLTDAEIRGERVSKFGRCFCKILKKDFGQAGWCWKAAGTILIKYRVGYIRAVRYRKPCGVFSLKTEDDLRCLMITEMSSSTDRKALLWIHRWYSNPGGRIYFPFIFKALETDRVKSEDMTSKNLWSPDEEWGIYRERQVNGRKDKQTHKHIVDTHKNLGHTCT